MKKLLLVFTLSLMLLQVSSAQIVLNKPLSERLTYYRINSALDITTKIVKGEMNAYWVNNTTDKVTDVQLHMYLNAFSSNNSTYYKESGGDPGSKDSDFGWIDINTITGKDGTDLTSMMKFISPDDGNPDDKTVLKIDLPKPAEPGDTVFLNVDFESKLPSKIIRTGYSDDYFFVAQWFPKFGVYEPAGMRYASKGGWNCHQFHSQFRVLFKS